MLFQEFNQTLVDLSMTLRGQRKTSEKGGAPVVLALHGWLDNSASLVPLLQEMKFEANFYALDLPGHGFSDHFSGFRGAQFADYLYALDEFLGLFKTTRVHLIGHSMGGIIANCYASAFPERVLSLSLIDSMGPIVRPAEDMNTRMRARVNTRTRLQKQKPQTLSFQSALDRWVKASGLGRELARPIVQRNLYPKGDRFQWRYDPCLQLPSVYTYTEDHIETLLRATTMPTLVVSASEGLLMNNESLLNRRLAFLPQARHESFSGGHHIHLEKPTEVARVCDAHLKCNG